MALVVRILAVVVGLVVYVVVVAALLGWLDARAIRKQAEQDKNTEEE